MRAREDIDITGGDVGAKNALVLEAQRDLKLSSTTAESTDGQVQVLQRVARLHLSDEAAS